MNWFKTLWLSSEEREILRKAKNNELVEKPSPLSALIPEDMHKKPYQKIIYSNGTVQLS